jgi:hypothetical protein
MNLPKSGVVGSEECDLIGNEMMDERGVIVMLPHEGEHFLGLLRRAISFVYGCDSYAPRVRSQSVKSEG